MVILLIMLILSVGIYFMKTESDDSKFGWFVIQWKIWTVIIYSCNCIASYYSLMARAFPSVEYPMDVMFCCVFKSM